MGSMNEGLIRAMMSATLRGCSKIDHNHDGEYQPKGSYSAVGHKHDDLYVTQGEMEVAMSDAIQAAKDSGELGGITEEDKTAMIQGVIAHFAGQPIVGVVDGNNGIILNGTLPVGKYTLKYEGDGGEFSDIVELTITEEDLIPYINVLSLATDTTGAVYNGVGYRNGYRASASTFESELTGVASTGFIPIKAGDVLRFKNCNLYVSPVENATYVTSFYLYDSQKKFLISLNATNIKARFTGCKEDGNEYSSVTMSSTAAWGQDDSQWAYVRFTSAGLSKDSIVTINQEIV